MRERTIKALSAIKGLELITPDESVTPYGLVQNDEQARSVIKFFREKEVDGILIGGMDFADEVSAATVAAAIGKPTLLFATKEGELMPDRERASDSFCGSLSIAVALHRRKVPFVGGGVVWPEDAEFLAQVQTFVRTCAALKSFYGARIGQIGVRPERFETVAYDEPLLLGKFGQKVVPTDLAEMIRAATALGEDSPEVKAVVEDIKSEVTNLNIGSKTLVKLAQYELAIINWMKDKNLDAVAHGSGPLRAFMGISSWSVLGRLTDKGYMASVETDILGALDMVALYSADLKQTVPFHMDWTIAHRTRPNLFLAWHPGNGPVSLAAPNSEIILRNRGRALDAPIPDDDIGGGFYEFELKTGPATFTRLVEYDGQYKMLITKGEIVTDPDKELQVGGWVEVKDLKNLYDTLFAEGFIHHATMAYGDLTETMVQFCKFAGIKTVIV